MLVVALLVTAALVAWLARPATHVTPPIDEPRHAESPTAPTATEPSHASSPTTTTSQSTPSASTTESLDHASVVVTVVDDRGDPVPGIPLRAVAETIPTNDALDADTQSTIDGTTDDAGRATLRLPSGSFSVVANKENQRPDLHLLEIPRHQRVQP